jgi:hypothetical protein
LWSRSLCRIILLELEAEREDLAPPAPEVSLPQHLYETVRQMKIASFFSRNLGLKTVIAFSFLGTTYSELGGGGLPTVKSVVAQ